MQQPESADLVAVRHDWILERLSSDRRVTTAAAAAALGVSVDTIRRDLRHLHGRGLVRRVHGGATAVSPLARSFTGRSLEDPSERNRLAEAVIARFLPGMVVGLDAGTTSTEIAARIPRSLEITIVTNNPAAVVALVDHPHASVVLVGGDVDLQWLAVTGSTAVDVIRNHHLDLAVVGICSFDPGAGATTRSLREVPTKRAWIEAAAETLVPTESHKVGTVAPFGVADPSDVTLLVVTGAIESALLERCAASGADVVAV